MKVIKSDLEKIGYQTYPNDNGTTNFICDVNTANIEEILLRNILELFDSEILSAVDFFTGNDDEQIDIEFRTNLPWETYQSINKN